MESSQVNDKAWIRMLTLLAYKIASQKYLWRLWQRPRRPIVLPMKMCIESSSCTTLAEANAMQFVALHTSIPVPKVYCAFKYKGRVYILMEWIAGEPLSRGWVQRSEESKQKILDQLRTMIHELRSIEPKSDVGVSNVDGGSIYDQRLPKKSLWGPFKTIQDFHRELRDGVEVKGLTDEIPPDLDRLVSYHNQHWPKSVFTHGDLSSSNVLVQGDEIVDIIDWETAGWYPLYWEYVTAWNVNPLNQFWQQEVDLFLTPMPYDLEMDGIRRRYFGDF